MSPPASSPPSPIPRDPAVESAPAFLAEGYEFIRNRCRRFGSDIFRTRFLLEDTICIQGEEAAEVFYSDDRFTRKGAVPPPVVTLLQGFGSVQTLDGDDHRDRKAMLMSLMTPEAIAGISEIMAEEWRRKLPAWERQGRIVLFDEVEEILTRTICRWAGVPLTEEEVAKRTRELAGIIQGAGSIGLRQVRGQIYRQSLERWARGVIEAVRRGEITPPEGSAAQVIATHHGRDGLWLETGTAAIELLNILRPTVAVGRFIVFAALALHRHPDDARGFQEGEEEDPTFFVQEVRRLSPFFPAIGGRVKTPFLWRGHYFDAGRRVLLDIYGTNRDPRSWKEPEQFKPERFRDWQGNAYSLIPQGGGAFEADHRCPGEWITIDLMKTAVRLLTREMRYRVPPQDLSVSLSRMPAEPRSRFVISEVRPLPAA